MRILIRRLKHKLYKQIIDDGLFPLVMMAGIGIAFNFFLMLVVGEIVTGLGLSDQALNIAIWVSILLPQSLILGTLISAWFRTRALFLMTMARELRTAARKATDKGKVSAEVIRSMAAMNPLAFNLIKGARGYNLFFLLFAPMKATFKSLGTFTKKTVSKSRYPSEYSYSDIYDYIPVEWKDEVSELFQRKDVSTLSILRAIKKFPAVTDFGSQSDALPERSFSAPLQVRHDKLNDRFLALQDAEIPLSSNSLSGLMNALQEIEATKNDPFRMGDLAQAIEKAERNMQSLEDTHRNRQKSLRSAGARKAEKRYLSQRDHIPYY